MLNFIGATTEYFEIVFILYFLQFVNPFVLWQYFCKYQKH